MCNQSQLKKRIPNLLVQNSSLTVTNKRNRAVLVSAYVTNSDEIGIVAPDLELRRTRHKTQSCAESMAKLSCDYFTMKREDGNERSDQI